MNMKTEKKLLNTFSFSSLTDIVLLLLIFFFFFSSYIVQPGIKIELPRSETTEVNSEKSITVSLTKDGAIYLNDERVTIASLPSLLQQKLIFGPEQVVIIKADRSTTLEQTVEIMDITKRVGFERFLIATQEKK